MTPTQKPFYKKTKTISNGKFSNVYKCTWNSTKNHVAGKKKKKNNDCGPKWQEELQVVKELGRIYCKNVVRYLSFYYEDDNHYHFFMELCDCNLEEYIKNKKITPHAHFVSVEVHPQKHFKTSFLKLLHQTANGLKYLHDSDIIHRNLNSTNILLVQTQNGKTLAKLAGFGFSKKIVSEFSTIDAHEQKKPSHSQHNNVGQSSETERWKKSLDMFSYGVLCYYVLTKGSNPFGEMGSAIKENIKNKNSPNFDKLRNDSSLGYSEENRITMIDMIKRLTSHDPEERMTVEQVIAHPSFYSPEKKINFLLKICAQLEKEPDCSVDEYDEGLVDDKRAGEIFFFLIKKDHLPKYFTLKHSKPWQRVECFDADKCHPTLLDWMRILRNKYEHAADRGMPKQFYTDFCKKDSHQPDPEKFLNWFVSKSHPQLLVHLYEHSRKKNDLHKQSYPDQTNVIKLRFTSNSVDFAKIMVEEEADEIDSGKSLKRFENFFDTKRIFRAKTGMFQFFLLRSYFWVHYYNRKKCDNYSSFTTEKVCCDS